MSDCGCTAEAGAVQHCPLHLAAPELRQALADVLEFVDDLIYGSESDMPNIARIARRGHEALERAEHGITQAESDQQVGDGGVGYDGTYNDGGTAI